MVLIALVLHACALRGQPPKAPVPTPLTMIALHNHLDSPTVTAIPPALTARLLDLLSERNLQPQPLPIDERFSRQRTTTARLGLLTAPGLVLLLESQAEYISQIQGRLRWNVQVTLSLDPPEAEPITETFIVPVFLQYLHQDAEDALIEAAPLIERRLATLIDRYLTGLSP